MKLTEKFLVSTVGGENVILPVDSNCVEFNCVYSLNETGMFLVENLKEEKSFDELLALFLNEFDVEEEVAKIDIANYVEELKKIGIVEN